MVSFVENLPAGRLVIQIASSPSERIDHEYEHKEYEIGVAEAAPDIKEATAVRTGAAWMEVSGLAEPPDTLIIALRAVGDWSKIAHVQVDESYIN
ncbi:hypothetical protein [Enterobacter cloacae]|uniref:hypothetical protein n=1 Tax=Enterobacter cloacae TaxID=550 RepID=UPI00101B0789|nr:hypothetical protein [Enterobacter cloacae]QBC03334.1 hypothetical protein EWI30_15125 [Enterobacter cloacae]